MLAGANRSRLGVSGRTAIDSLGLHDGADAISNHSKPDVHVLPILNHSQTNGSSRGAPTHDFQLGKMGNVLFSATIAQGVDSRSQKRQQNKSPFRGGVLMEGCWRVRGWCQLPTHQLDDRASAATVNVVPTWKGIDSASIPRPRSRTYSCERFEPGGSRGRYGSFDEIWSARFRLFAY